MPQLFEMLDAKAATGQDDTDDQTGLSEVLKFRLDRNLLARLDRIVAYANGRGHRDVNRSWVLRDALDAYITGVEEKIPEVRKKN